MPVLSRFYGIIIRMYFLQNEHNPPHIHAIYNEDVAAIDFIKQHGGKNIKFMCIIAAPEGLKRLSEAHPDIQIYVGNLDRCLNETAYICPGLGDAGDRIFGTI